MTKTARSVHGLLVSTVVAAALVTLLTIQSRFGGGLPAQGGPVQAAGLRLAIDADTTNGVCTTVDSARTVTVGDTYSVAVCVENLPQEIDAFDLDIYYNDTLNHVPDLPDEIPALDDNPDANAGTTVFSIPDLGDGWDCSGLGGLKFPIGDQNPSSGPGQGDAFITCDNFAGGTHYLAGKSLPLAIIHIEALAAGDDSLVFANLGRLAWQSTTVALCNPESARAIPCDGATVAILPAPTATATPTPTPSPTPTSSPTPTPSPTPTTEPQPDTDGGGAPDSLELAVGGNPLDPADDAAILTTDNDGDGCTNRKELAGAPAPAPGSTGAYDPVAYYDFYDVPVPANADPAPNGTRSGTVTLADVLAVLRYVGTSDGGSANTNGVSYDSDKDGDTVGDGHDYDRSPSPLPNPPWDAGPPNGAVNMADVLAALAQVGLDCAGTP